MYSPAPTVPTGKLQSIRGFALEAGWRELVAQIRILRFFGLQNFLGLGLRKKMIIESEPP
jgi:hypothetical protein